MCTDMCTGTCMRICVGMAIGARIDMDTDMCIDMHIDINAGPAFDSDTSWRGDSRHVSKWEPPAWQKEEVITNVSLITNMLVWAPLPLARARQPTLACIRAHGPPVLPAADMQCRHARTHTHARTCGVLLWSLHADGLYSYGLYSYGLHSYGPHSYGSTHCMPMSGADAATRLPTTRRSSATSTACTAAATRVSTPTPTACPGHGHMQLYGP